MRQSRHASRLTTRLGPQRVTQLGAWQFLSVPSAPEAHAVFFGAGGLPPNDPDSVLAHGNGASRLAGARVEGGPALEQLLASLGSHACDSYRLPDGRLGVRRALSGGWLVVIRSRNRRLLGVEVKRAEPGPPTLNEPLRGFWVPLR